MSNEESVELLRDVTNQIVNTFATEDIDYASCECEGYSMLSDAIDVIKKELKSLAFEKTHKFTVRDIAEGMLSGGYDIADRNYDKFAETLLDFLDAEFDLSAQISCYFDEEDDVEL